MIKIKKLSEHSIQPLAVMSLLAGATVWGLMWYPYRLLALSGLSGIFSTTLIYAVTLFISWLITPQAWRKIRFSWRLVLIGLGAGGCNLGYVLGTLHGEIMRVLLLFYLAPVWTVLLARLLLRERLNLVGMLIIALSLGGASVMLWQSSTPIPIPQNFAEWMGLLAGFLFAFTNVLVLKTSDIAIDVKCLTVCIGVLCVSVPVLFFEDKAALIAPLLNLPLMRWMLLVFMGGLLFAVNLTVQFGLMQIPANRAVVILLFELIVAAISSWALAGETMGAKEWLGGIMILAASLLSGKLNKERN